MKTKYIIIGDNKKNARQAFLDGDFMTWTDKNLKDAFNFWQGTIKDFKRFLKDNAGNTTAIYIDSLNYIDSDKPCDITRTDIESVFFKYGIAL